jgi:hypothetical protein
MKNTIFLSALAGACMLAQTTTAQTATPVINERQHIQHNRIKQGVNSGELTHGEARRLKGREAHIQHQKQMYKEQGNVTPGERAQLRREQNNTSKAIYRDKHNAKVN